MSCKATLRNGIAVCAWRRLNTTGRATQRRARSRAPRTPLFAVVPQFVQSYINERSAGMHRRSLSGVAGS